MGKGLGNEYPPIDNPTCFPCASALHATNVTQAISCLLKLYAHVRQDQESPERRPHSVSAKRRHCEARVCPCRASEVIAQEFFDEESPSGKGISPSIMYSYKELLTSERDLLRRRRGTRRTRWLAARRRK